MTCNIILVSGYNVMIWCWYILRCDHHNKPSYHTLYKITKLFFSLCWELLGLTLGNFQLCITILLTTDYGVHYIPIISLFYNWKLLPLDPFTHFARPSNSLPSSNHLSFLCIYVLWGYFCFFGLDSTNKWNHMAFSFSDWLLFYLE